MTSLLAHGIPVTGLRDNTRGTESKQRADPMKARFFVVVYSSVLIFNLLTVLTIRR